MDNIIRIIAKENNWPEKVVSTVLDLLENGATIPFIARYRKEMTGGFDENQLRLIEERADYLKSLNERKITVVNTITELGKMTPDLSKKIEDCLSLTELEDISQVYQASSGTRNEQGRGRGHIEDQPRSRSGIYLRKSKEAFLQD